MCDSKFFIGEKIRNANILRVVRCSLEQSWCTWDHWESLLICKMGVKYSDSAYITLWMAGSNICGELEVELGTGELLLFFPWNGKLLLLLLSHSFNKYSLSSYIMADII